MSAYDEAMGGVAYVLAKLGYKVKAHQIYHLSREMDGTGRISWQDENYTLHQVVLNSVEMETYFDVRRS